jgi:hypothetical protein
MYELYFRRGNIYTKIDFDSDFYRIISCGNDQAWNFEAFSITVLVATSARAAKNSITQVKIVFFCSFLESTGIIISIAILFSVWVA